MLEVVLWSGGDGGGGGGGGNAVGGPMAVRWQA